MNALERILSRPVAKPYRSGKIDPSVKPFLNDNGHVDFAPGDIENPKEWSTKRRWYCTVVAVVLVCNATFASSSPSGCLRGISEEFHVSEVAAGLVITLFLVSQLAQGAGQVFLLPAFMHICSLDNAILPEFAHMSLMRLAASCALNRVRCLPIEPSRFLCRICGWRIPMKRALAC